MTRRYTPLSAGYLFRGFALVVAHGERASMCVRDLRNAARLNGE
jgi:hypothetical protein